MHLYLAAISSSTTRGPERTGVWTHTSRTRKRAPFNKGDFCIALSWARPSAVVGAHSSSSTESASRGSDGFSWPSGARTAAKPAWGGEKSHTHEVKRVPRSQTRFLSRSRGSIPGQINPHVDSGCGPGSNTCIALARCATVTDTQTTHITTTSPGRQVDRGTTSPGWRVDRG